MERFARGFKSALLSIVNVDHPVQQGITTMVVSAIAVQSRLLLIPLAVQVLLNIADFVTGMRAARHRGEEIASAKYLLGIEKKVYLLLLVGIGLLLDVVILYTTHAFSLSITLPVSLAVIISLWIVVNEIISILENLEDIGVDLPKWLLPFTKGIKSKVESVSPSTKEDANNE